MCHLVVPPGCATSSELAIASPIPSAELPGAQGRVCSQLLRLKLPLCVVFSPLLCPKLCCRSLLLPKSLPPMRILRMNLLALGLAFQAGGPGEVSPIGLIRHCSYLAKGSVTGICPRCSLTVIHWMGANCRLELQSCWEPRGIWLEPKGIRIPSLSAASARSFLVHPGATEPSPRTGDVPLGCHGWPVLPAASQGMCVLGGHVQDTSPGSGRSGIPDFQPAAWLKHLKGVCGRGSPGFALI